MTNEPKPDKFLDNIDEMLKEIEDDKESITLKPLTQTNTRDHQVLPAGSSAFPDGRPAYKKLADYRESIEMQEARMKREQLDKKIAEFEKLKEQEKEKIELIRKEERVNKILAEENKKLYDKWQEQTNKDLENKAPQKIVVNTNSYIFYKTISVILLVSFIIMVVFYGYGVYNNKFGMNSNINNTLLNTNNIANNFTINNNINITEPRIIVNNTVIVNVCNVNGNMSTC